MPEEAGRREHQRYWNRKTLHRARPEYGGEPFRLSKEDRRRIWRRLSFLYGTVEAERWLQEVERLCQVHHAHKPEAMLLQERDLDPLERFTEEDVILITYGDLLHGPDRSPLTTLSKFCGQELEGCINTLHILPFFPFSSDRGFAVIDFDSVDPRLGTWADIEDLERRYRLMFDGVINHVSSRSRWFQEFLNGHPHYRGYFVSFQDPEDMDPKDRNLIFRPRTSDVLTRFETLQGPRFVWTTFSGDQVDLNYRNPEVLVRVLEVLLGYVRRGADLLRLDAVTYLWRRAGTSCIHLPETHATVKLIRDVLSAVAPQVALVTETNVPHAENIAYFGDGTDEAHLVYNFALPPLLLHTFYTGDATRFTEWARTLDPPSDTTGFLNFLDSHDGMGLLAVRGLLSDEEILTLVVRAQVHGGLISHRDEGSGNTSPYEINITWYSALNAEGADETLDLQVERFLASRAIAMALRGVPGIYLHSLFGTRNDQEAVMRSGINRDINRRTVDLDALRAAMADPETSIARILDGVKHLLRVRTRERAFHPRGSQKVLDLPPWVVGVERRSPEGDRQVLTLTNVTPEGRRLTVPRSELPSEASWWIDVLTGNAYQASSQPLDLRLPPYGRLWLVPESQAL